MKMKIFLLLAIAICAHAAAVKEKENVAESEKNKDKRQTEDEAVSPQYHYRAPRKQEPVAPVEEPQEDDKEQVDRSGTEEYRPGQVFTLNTQELLALQPERKASSSNSQQLQQLYSDSQPEHKQNLQQFYYLEQNTGRQATLQPSSHAVIARPHYSSNGGEASVGAALSVSDSGSNPSDIDPELLALLGQAPVRSDDSRQSYSQSQVQQVAPQNIAPQYQQVDRYIAKPSKKQNKLNSKLRISPPQPSSAPQQYLIETTNVQQQAQERPQYQQKQYQVQPQYQQYRSAPQPQRPPQSLRYVSIPAQPAPQQLYYERPETQGLKVVAAPNLQQLRPQLNYRILPYQQQPEAAPKQYRIIEVPRVPIRQEQRIPSPSVERPTAYLKRFPDPEKIRTVKIYEPEGLSAQQPIQIVGDQYVQYVSPIYRNTEQRGRYDFGPVSAESAEQSRPVEPSKPPQSSIYVSKNLAPKKTARPQSFRSEPSVKIEHPTRDQLREQQEQTVNLDHYSQSLEEQRAQLPPPKNNKAYTPEEFNALIAAGYSVTPIPVSSVPQAQAQSRTIEEEQVQEPRQQSARRHYNRRHHYLPLRADDAP